MQAYNPDGMLDVNHTSQNIFIWWKMCHQWKCMLGAPV